MFPNAATKSLHWNSRCNLPFTRLHPFTFFSPSCTSASLNFFAGITLSSNPRNTSPLCTAIPVPGELANGLRVRHDPEGIVGSLLVGIPHGNPTATSDVEGPVGLRDYLFCLG